MFKKAIEKFGPLEQVTYYHESHRCAASIIPAFGANLRALVLTHENQSINCIDGVKSYHELITDSAFKSAFLLPWPNRVKNGEFQLNSQPFSLPINEVPRNHAIHGFLYRHPFIIIEESLQENEAIFTLKNEYRGNYPGYPFCFNTTIEFRLDLNQGLLIKITIENTDQENIPVGIGWHPYFQFGETVDQYQLEMPAVKAFELDKKFIPTGNIVDYKEFNRPATIANTKFDSSFRLLENTGKVTTKLIEPDRKLAIECWQETGKDKYDYLQVYIPKHRMSLAIEPMTCGIDAYNNGEGNWRLAPGSAAGGSFGVSLNGI
jgi:aldose 1-epimerase